MRSIAFDRQASNAIFIEPHPDWRAKFTGTTFGNFLCRSPANFFTVIPRNLAISSATYLTYAG